MIFNAVALLASSNFVKQGSPTLAISHGVKCNTQVCSSSIPTHDFLRYSMQRWNGLRIKINGMLLPGDRLVARKEPVVLGLCHRKFPYLQRSGSHA